MTCSSERPFPVCHVPVCRTPLNNRQWTTQWNVLLKLSNLYQVLQTLPRILPHKTCTRFVPCFIAVIQTILTKPCHAFTNILHSFFPGKRQSNNWQRHDDTIKWKHFPGYWPFVPGIHRSLVNSHHKGQLRGALVFPLISAWINGWVNNQEAGDLGRHCAHYDVTVMTSEITSKDMGKINQYQTKQAWSEHNPWDVVLQWS